jgi:glycosyltransferase involved in cell wall biosynthesis
MKVVINLLPFTSYQGIEGYASNLIKVLVNDFPRDEFFLVKTPFSPSCFSISLPNISDIIVPLKNPRKSLLAKAQQVDLLCVIRSTKADILFCPSPAAPLFLKKKVVTIHDCAYDRLPEAESIFSKWYFKMMFYAAKYCSKGVLTVSEFSKNELMDIYNFKPSQIHVTYPALPKLPSVSPSAEEVLKKFFLEKGKYFFYIGNMRPRKNIGGVLRAFARFSEENSDYKLVIAGKIETRFIDIKADALRYGIESRVVLPGFISEEEKVVLYRNAAALTFPSYYEGFGIPVIEAQSLGVPVITANTSSLPEVGGEGGALYVDPHDIDTIADAMDKVTKDAGLRASLITAGRENVKRFSWEKAARETMAVFRAAAGEKGREGK